MPTYTANKDGTYWVKVTDTLANCSSITSITLECNIEPIIPNVFTPNGDGFNDNFVIKNTYGWNIDLKIYNRWGNIVYQSSNYQNNWDGKDVADGTYYYIIKAKNLLSNYEKELHGSLTILR